jgi:hypothetical protein
MLGKLNLVIFAVLALAANGLNMIPAAAAARRASAALVTRQLRHGGQAGPRNVGMSTIAKSTASKTEGGISLTRYVGCLAAAMALSFATTTAVLELTPDDEKEKRIQAFQRVLGWPAFADVVSPPPPSGPGDLEKFGGCLLIDDERSTNQDEIQRDPSYVGPKETVMRLGRIATTSLGSTLIRAAKEWEEQINSNVQHMRFACPCQVPNVPSVKTRMDETMLEFDASDGASAYRKSVEAAARDDY